jgi:molybdopterin-guanine dinucleotide biosynthesis protein A
MPVYILSQPIQTGKTGILQQWLQNQPNAHGILTPDLNGKRMLYDIGPKIYHPLQIETKEESIDIGKFTFSKKGFENARNIILQALHKNPEWLIIDEIGRLEMDRHEGLEPAVGEVIALVKTKYTQVNLLLVIRDYLLQPAINYYQLSEAKILTAPNLIYDLPLPNGLILCGGQSMRMGKDKAMIVYHGMAQYRYVYQNIFPFCKSVFISCNENQKEIQNSGLAIVQDNPCLSHAGPITGLMSFILKEMHGPILLCGCDYPFANAQTYLKLIQARSPEIDIVCYVNPETGFDEPLLAIYETSALVKLKVWFKEGNQSLRHFLKTMNVKRIVPNTPSEIKSIDTPNDIANMPNLTE